MRELRILVEGDDDQRFIDRILRPYVLKIKPALILTIQYAQDTKKSVNGIIRNLDAHNHNYILLGDYDSSDICITSKKNDLIKKFNSLNPDSIFIVKDEIESWFISGIDTDLDEFKEFTCPEDTEQVTKEIFNDMWHNSHFDSKIDFMIEISKSFDFNLAMKRNASFKYFIEKLNRGLSMIML